MRHLNSVSNGILLECPVVRSEYKGHPDYPYRCAVPPTPRHRVGRRGCCCRTHAALKLRAVPTLYRWGAVQPRAVLVEDECKVESKVAALVEDLVE